jgi:hypothetical protein
MATGQEDADMARTSDEDLMIAAEWLGVNNGDNGEAESCQRVATMLEKMIKQRHEEAAVRAVAKENGVRPSLVRRALRNQQSS